MSIENIPVESRQEYSSAKESLDVVLRNCALALLNVRDSLESDQLDRVGQDLSKIKELVSGASENVDLLIIALNR